VSVVATSNKSASSHEMPSTLIIRKVKSPFISFCYVLYKVYRRGVRLLGNRIWNKRPGSPRWTWSDKCSLSSVGCDCRPCILQDVSLATVRTVKSQRWRLTSRKEKQPCRAATLVHFSIFSLGHWGVRSKQNHEWCHWKIGSGIVLYTFNWRYKNPYPFLY
jgi:hypothetical protein